MNSLRKLALLALLVNSFPIYAQEVPLEEEFILENLNEDADLVKDLNLLEEASEPDTVDVVDSIPLEELDFDEDLEKIAEEPAKSEKIIKESVVEQKPVDEKLLDEQVQEISDNDLELLKEDIKESLPDGEKLIDQDDIGQDTSKFANDPLNLKRPETFDVGDEEKELLELASNIKGQVSSKDWNEIATAAQVSSYTVVKDDWLFKISKRLFGTGHYYPKIWALNPYITNPHLIEPGMILSFSTGSSLEAPKVKVGSFTKAEIEAEPGRVKETLVAYNDGSGYEAFGDNVKPKWLNEREKILQSGKYIQYADGNSVEDLNQINEKILNNEYESYEPPQKDIAVQLAADQYDKDGFDKTSRISFGYKEGFYLTTFLSTNIVQDFGKIDSAPRESTLFTGTDHAFVQFDEGMNILPGDLFSIYAAQGEVSHENSDRKGYKYTIIGQIKVLGRIENKWEVEILETYAPVKRDDRITVYTPKIDKITKTFSNQVIEAAIMQAYTNLRKNISFGDIVYLDRGRADGVEVGNVFEAYGFKDRITGRTITSQPTYKNGELTVITLTDNFATALVTQSKRDFFIGDIAITKTKEAALREGMAKKGLKYSTEKALTQEALEELDVELNLDNLGESILKDADKIQLTEDELAELERQERERSVITESEKDLKALERLENEIESTEKLIDEAKRDEDKLLENQSLNQIEEAKRLKQQESLDDIEENVGKKYLDQNINDKDNPYGLTEFDIEEIDELLNTDNKNANQ